MRKSSSNKKAVLKFRINKSRTFHDSAFFILQIFEKRSYKLTKVPTVEMFIHFPPATSLCAICKVRSCIL